MRLRRPPFPFPCLNLWELTLPTILLYSSPETITALEEERNAVSPRSPRPRGRRASTGPISPALRPVVIDRDDDAAEEEAEAGPAKVEPHAGPPVDEVEFGASGFRVFGGWLGRNADLSLIISFPTSQFTANRLV